MRLFRSRFLLLFVVLAGFTLGSCKKTVDAPASTTLSASQQLTTGSWRLDQIKQGGQVTSSDTGIKDRYSLTFRPDGTCTQKQVNDNSTYPGTWMLMNNNATLHLTDSKGTGSEYAVASLTATELRYTFTNKNNQLEERTFSAQP